jgi:hypothetical protein
MVEMRWLMRTREGPRLGYWVIRKDWRGEGSELTNRLFGGLLGCRENHLLALGLGGLLRRHGDCEV